MRMRGNLVLLLAAGAAAQPALPIASIISATHWVCNVCCGYTQFSVVATCFKITIFRYSPLQSPCYYISDKVPSLWDGAAALATTGTTSIKLVLDAGGTTTYPWNTDWTPILANVHSLADLAATPIYDTVFRGRDDLTGSWNYSVFDLITYRVSGTGDWNYWCSDFTPDDGANETTEFRDLTAYLLRSFEGTGKRFMLEHWEGDWSAHCGNYDPTRAPDPAVQARMVQWLAARQAGVNAGRTAWCNTARVRGGALADLDCSDGRAIHAAAGIEVLHATEVNLVLTSMRSGFPNNILQVVPHVALDLISYSSYDTQFLNPGFGEALDFIASHHNRTSASLTPGVYVAEVRDASVLCYAYDSATLDELHVTPITPSLVSSQYGVAQNEDTTADLLAVYQNVNAWALSTGPSGARRALYTFAWELFCNEVDNFPGQRCNSDTGPQFNASHLHGFWLIRPDGRCVLSTCAQVKRKLRVTLYTFHISPSRLQPIPIIRFSCWINKRNPAAPYTDPLCAVRCGARHGRSGNKWVRG